MTSSQIAYSTKEEVEKFKKDAKKFADNATANPTAALATLVELGIYTKSGRLTSAYGGAAKKRKK